MLKSKFNGQDVAHAYLIQQHTHHLILAPPFLPLIKLTTTNLFNSKFSDLLTTHPLAKETTLTCVTISIFTTHTLKPKPPKWQPNKSTARHHPPHSSAISTPTPSSPTRSQPSTPNPSSSNPSPSPLNSPTPSPTPSSPTSARP